MIVIITGGSRGIGKATALKFAEAGHHLILCSKSKEHLSKAQTEISSAFPTQVDIFDADLSKKTETAKFASFCLTIGTPDVLVNNAGVYKPGNCFNEAENQMEQMMDLNFFSAYHLTRALVPSMIEKKSGHIFNLCSIASLQSYEGGGSYSVSKFALNGFSQNIRHELKNFGIKVTAVFPGAVHTDTWGDYDNSNHRIMEANDIAEMIFAATKLSKQAVVEEILIRPQLGDL
jgi:short-subunit dehydrogenase